MMNFAEDPSLIISNSIIFDGLMGEFLSETIDNFDLFKVQDNTTAGTAWNVFDLIGLKGDLDGEVLGNERYHKMEPRFCP
jgi:hypothetical protein